MPGVLIILICGWPDPVLTASSALVCPVSPALCNCSYKSQVALPLSRPSVTTHGTLVYHLFIPMLFVPIPWRFGAHAAESVELSCFFGRGSILKSRQKQLWGVGLLAHPKGSDNVIHFLNIISYLHKKERHQGKYFEKADLLLPHNFHLLAAASVLQKYSAGLWVLVFH